MDVKGITGKKQFISVMPYKMIQYFTVQTVGFTDLILNTKLALQFSNGHTRRFEFKGKCKALELGKMIETQKQ